MQTFSHSLPMLLYGTLDAVMPRFRKIFKKFGLTEQQWRVLRVLWEADGVAFQDMAEFTLIPPPSLVGVLDRLSAAGLIERRRSETDRRQVSIFATDKGKALENDVRPEVVSAYVDLQASIDADTWRQLIAGMQQVIETCQTKTPKTR